MNLVDYEKYYHSGSEFIIPRDEFEKIIEENQRLKKDYATIVSNNCDYLLLEKENQRLKNIIYTTLEYVDREEVSSVGTPFTSTSIGKEIKELLEGEKTFNSIWKENQRLNNILNELEKWLKETDRTIDFNYVVVRVKDILEKMQELKEGDK